MKQLRIRVFALAAGVLLSLSLTGLPAWAEEAVAVDTDARSCILMEQSTGEILYGENIHEQLEPASVTKVMTMLLVMEAMDAGQIREDDVVTASEYAAGMGGSQIYLEAGEQMTVRDLLKAVAVVSGNDAAVALAEYVAGSESTFVEKMNLRAVELGMEDSHFVNCNGLPAEGHVTSAYDIAVMSRALMSHPRILEDTTIWTDSLRDGAFGLANTNKLLRSYSGCTGLKTGYTDTAGYCLSATATREGLSLVAVVMGASTSALRFSTAAQLLDYGFANYALVSVTPDQVIPPVSVTLGEVDTVQSMPEAKTVLVSKADAPNITTRVELPERVPAPVEQGQQLGELVVLCGETEVTRVPITAQTAVARLTFSGMFRRLLGQMCAL